MSKGYDPLKGKTKELGKTDWPKIDHLRTNKPSQCDIQGTLIRLLDNPRERPSE